jgi:hypothetical protein
VNAFHQNRVVIGQQVAQEVIVLPALDNMRYGGEQPERFTFIVIDRNAVFIKFMLLSPALVKTLLVDLYTLLLHGRKVVKKIEDPAVIDRVGNSE